MAFIPKYLAVIPRLREMWNDRHTRSEILHALDISLCTLFHAVKAARLPRKPRTACGPGHQKRVRRYRAVIAKRDAGWSIAQIARECGISKKRVLLVLSVAAALT